MSSSKRENDGDVDRLARQQKTIEALSQHEFLRKCESYRKEFQEWLRDAEMDKPEDKLSQSLMAELEAGLNNMTKSLHDMRELVVQVSIAAAVQSPTFLPEPADDRVVAMLADLRRDLRKLGEELHNMQTLLRRLQIATAPVKNVTASEE